MTENWHAEVTVQRWAELPADEQVEALLHALPGFGIAVDDGERRVTLHAQVEAATVRLACETAIRAARDAWSRAFGTHPAITGVRVITEQDHEREMISPAAIDLIGKNEAAQMLRVSPQRVDELSRTHPAFPAPVATPKMGPVYTRASIEVFDKTWERRRTGRPRKATTPTTR